MIREAPVVGESAPAILDWDQTIPKFADFLAEVAARAAALSSGTRLNFQIDPARLGDSAYRAKLVQDAKNWRGARLSSTVYTFAYAEPFPGDLIDPFIDAAEEQLASLGRARAFPQRAKRVESRCLYVGHSLTMDTRLRDHLGDGSAKTSSLHLQYWAPEVNETIEVCAYGFAEVDRLLARMLEDYLWDALKPLVGRRGGK